ncbi:MAG: leucine--tRNA ligase [Candidatus Thorarchaeota archaeon]
MKDIYKQWNDAKVYSTDLNKTKEKFFIIFAYPGPSGYMHVGHLRSYTYPDVIAKFKRLQGYNVYFPAGIHASGLPAVQFSERVKSGDYNEYLKVNNATKEDIKKFRTPEGVVYFFANNYLTIWKKMGYFINEETGIPTTIDEGYKRFIQWQFRQLQKKKYLVQKKYISPICPNDGPVAIDTAETDLSEGGTAEIHEYTVILFKINDSTEYVMPVVTLRPETVFGVTNIWIHPEIKYIDVALVSGKHWIIAENNLKIFVSQEEISTITEIAIESLLSMNVINPINEEHIPLISNSIINPDFGTGISMSVPAHSPSDWIFSHDNKFINQTEIQVKKIINSDIVNIPAETIAKKFKISSVHDKERIIKATQAIDHIEYSNGKMSVNDNKFHALTVSEARDKIIKELISHNQGFQKHLFNQKVVCRCGERIQIRYVPDQWFIHYSDQEITEKTKSHIKTMNIFPKKFKNDFPKIIDWFNDRPCIRKGKWLGTLFPFNKEKEKWIIEPIADSTIYPAYYIISKYIHQNKIDATQLNDEFFTYIYFGEGDKTKISDRTNIAETLINSIRSDFEYWYPVNMNFGGREHKTVHFPVFLMNHQMIFEEKHQPKGIFVNWWVMQDISNSQKIAKSKGGAQSITQIINKFSADAIRLFYCHQGSPHIDIEWNEEKVRMYQIELTRVKILMNKFIESTINEQTNEIDNINDLDDWLYYECNKIFRNIWISYNNNEFRKVTQDLIYSIPQVINRFIQREGFFKAEHKNLIKTWIIYMSPLIPFFAEEMWGKMGYEGSIFETQEMKFIPDKKIKPNICYEEEYIDKVIKDIGNVKKIFSKKKIDGMDIFTSENMLQSGHTEDEILQRAKKFIEIKTKIKIRINPLISDLRSKINPEPLKVSLSIW